MNASSDATFFPLMSLADLVTTVQFFESSSDRVSDSFLDSLCAYVIAVPEFDLAIGGSSVANSICACCLRLSDPAIPVSGPVCISPRGFFGVITPRVFEC